MAPGADSWRPARILHVDDDPSVADRTAASLERSIDDLDVMTATSASDGLEIVRAEPLDCIVAESDLPSTDGIASLTAVREERPDLPFVLFTGTGSEAITSEAIAAGVTDYLRKTSASDRYAELADRIRNAVDGYRTRREARVADRQLRRIYEQIADAVVAIDTEWRIRTRIPRRSACSNDRTAT